MCLEVFHRILDHWCIIPGRQLSQVTKFCTVEYKMFSEIIASVGLFRTKVNIISHAPSRKRQIIVRLRSCRNCGFSGWNCLHVTLRAPQIWRWHL